LPLFHLLDDSFESLDQVVIHDMSIVLVLFIEAFAIAIASVSKLLIFR